MWRDGRLIRLFTIASVLVSALVWNLRFDRHIQSGVALYFEQHAAAARAGLSPPTLRAVMEPAAAHGVWDATLWAGVVLAACWAGLSMAQRVRTSTAH